MTREADIQQEAPESVELKDPVLAAFLAWLIPGLGHVYQGRYAKAALFFICIMGTFVFGLYLGGSSELGWGRCVYASLRKTDKETDRRLPYFCQIGIGLPAMPALVQASRMRSDKRVWGGDGFWKGFMAPPRLKEDDGLNPNADQPTVDELHRALHRYWELGTVYTMVAGLLNILAVYDAFAGPVFSENKKEEEEETDAEDEETSDEDSTSK